MPVDVAAVGVHTGLRWPDMLLAQGAAATVAFGWGALVERSVVLRWAWWAAVVALVGGIGATTGLPVPLLLAGVALAAAVGGRGRLELPALGWAGVVGLAPVGSLVERAATSGSGVLGRLGLAATDHPLAAGAASVLAAGTIAALGRRRDQADLVLLAAVVAGTGVASAWFATDPGAGSTAIALAGTFLALQLTALVLRDDPFWHRPVAAVATLAEGAGFFGLACLATIALAAQAVEDLDRGLGLAALVLGAGFVVADRRRGPIGMDGATTVVAIAAASAAALLTTDPIVLAGLAAGLAVAAVAADRRDGPVVTLAGAIAAPLVARPSWPMVAIVGAVGALALGEAAVRRSRRAAPGAQGRVDAETSWLLGAASLAPIGLAVAGVADSTGHLALSLVGGAVACVLLAAFVDRGVGVGSVPLGTIVRTGAVGMLVAVGDLPPHEAAVVAATVAGLSIADAVRLRSPRTALGASLAVPVAVGAFVHATGLSVPETGVALTVAAVVIAGLGSLLGRSWLEPVVAGVAIAAAGGLALAAGDPTALANALIVSGGLGLVAGVTVRRPELLLGGGLLGTVGWWVRLADAGVDVSEPYLVPVTAVLLLAAARSRTEGTSSWIAYGPSIALLGGSAFAERLAGGERWHALVAGAVGAVAVVAGGQRRLAGPLLLGTALLVALVGFETLAVTAGLPTWVWLAVGGTALVGAGVAMERNEVGPIETGRRLVDVVNERYS